MSLGVWLVALGMADLCRAEVDGVDRRRVVGVTGVGVVVVLGLTALIDRSEARWWAAVSESLALCAWVVCTNRAMRADRSASALERVLAVAILPVTLVGLLLLGEPQAAGWPTTLSDSPLARFDLGLVVLVAGVVLVQLATANVAVRLLLGAVGVPPAAGEKTLKGGRILGPLERLFIVALGLGGAATAAAVRVAAKGLLRFPELGRHNTGTSDLTEYFLIGSLSSWLWALGGIAIVLLSK